MIYPLDDVLLLSLLEVLAGAETFTDIARSGEANLDLLRRFRPYRHATPAHYRPGEIIAISKLVDMLVVAGAIVSIDAMGCQCEIARKVIDKDAAYVLALKGNQGTMHQDVEIFADEQKARDFKDTIISRHKTVEGDHGRVETRITTIVHDVEWLRARHDWPGLKSLALSRGLRQDPARTRFYLSSLTDPAEKLGPVIRSHRAIENSLH